MKKAFKYLLTKLFWGFGRHLLSDRWYAKIRYWLELDTWPDLQNPHTFTEKIQWIKLNERNELRQLAANRLEVRNYVADNIGSEHLIPLLDSFDELTKSVWQKLQDQFVLKANHGCEMVAIIRNKNDSSFEEIRQKTEEWQELDYYKFSREWAYKGLPRTILAEELLLDEDGTIPKDYKFFCFNGEVKVIQIDYDRFGDQKRNLFDRNFNRIEGELLYPPYEGSTEEPENLGEAIKIAEILSADFSFLRVDLYLMNQQVYFGELTNYPGNGFVPFQPKKLEYQFGSYITLSDE
ncbi:MAG: ATP-grasp fold amidoligase family protein [Bacteroidota bacterium]